jgi:uncharacterized protein
MPEHPPGTPSWVELSSPDPDASAAFYGRLMNRSATEPGAVEETGRYRMFQHDGQTVGGLVGHMQEGQPTAWSTSFSVRLGATITAEPMDMPIGRFAGIVDPQGAPFAVLQPAPAG